MANRQRLGLFMLILAMLVGLVAGFVLWPAYHRTSVNLSKLRELERSYIANVEKAKELLSLRKKSLKVQAELQRTYSLLPQVDDLASLLQATNDLAQQCNLEVTSLSPQLPSSSRSYETVKVTVNLTGRFFDLVDFLYKLENMPRLVRINSVVITEGEKGFPELNITVGYSAYYMPPATKQAAKPGQASKPGEEK